MIRADVVIIGAGAAGLAAANELSASGLSVVVAEARDRLGGRIATVHDPSWPVPVELGPEFVHGRPEETFSILTAAGLPVLRLPDVHWRRSPSGWKPLPDFWKTVDRVTATMRNSGEDRSVAGFLSAHRRLARDRRELLLSLVEGYHAAPADAISEHSLSTRGEEPEDHDQFRVPGGYDAIARWLARSSAPERVSIRLSTRASSVRWKKGFVEVEVAGASGAQRLVAPRAVVTVPIGVWKAPPDAEGAIRFVPDVPGKARALALLEMGPVVKVVLRFRERFWEDDPRGSARAAGGRPRLGFLHARGAPFPTWWGTEPLETPVLTGWAGGPAAAALAGLPGSEVAARALETIARLLGVSRRRAASSLEAWQTHDWQSDPFSRGAYSYVRPGGVSARGALARPVASTLFFAGEATDPEQSGTVAGAIASGRRAAAQVLRTRPPRRHLS